MAECVIQVGIRIRPLLKREQLQNISLNTYDSQSIEFKKQTFTFDHVFGPDLSQQQLYQNTAAPMLKSFLEGFNVTIIAYGQTGSGKTYSMGTGEPDIDLPDNQGLIPRFLCDLFENLKLSTTDEKVQASVKISFLEIYGEDVFDLLIPLSSNGSERGSLHIRENDQGMVFVQGQQDIQVQSAEDALQLLYSGSRNRVTGSTNMNAVSSRSHAVYTISLEQKIQSANDDDCHQIISKLTFVDLAGSERIKRTGAEGQRMKEGIQINSGLFNLGQVINGLADDQRIKTGQGKALHIPYRNSKLTHLLKDALGGNSQTLFLACVSPAESNEGETYTTLAYARQARNIKNKPIRNMDQTQQELRRLRLAAKVWMLKAVTNIFGDNSPKFDSSLSMSLENRSSNEMCSSPSSFGRMSVGGDDSLLRRTDVQEYIDAVNKLVQDRLSGTAPTPRKIRLSIAPPPSPFGTNKKRRPLLHTSTMMADLPGGMSCIAEEGASGGTLSVRDAEFREWNSSDLSDAVVSGSDGLDSKQHSMMLRDSVFESQDTEETERLVARMLEMVAKEKELCMQDSVDEEKVLAMESEIHEKEEILSKLMDTIKGFGPMKQEYERLLSQIGSLETERRDLEAQLEAVKKSSDHGGVVVEKLNERFVKVKDELSRMRSERTQKESAFRVMQRGSQQADSLQKELKKLRDTKIALMKAQKAQSQQYQKFKKEQSQKVQQLKKSDIKKQQQMNTLKSEVERKERLLGLKAREIDRISSKLKAAEGHIQSLLKTQVKTRLRWAATGPGSGGGGGGKGEENKNKYGLNADDLNHFLTAKSMLDSLVEDRVEDRRCKALFTAKSELLKSLNEELLDEACELKLFSDRKRLIEKELGYSADEQQQQDGAVGGTSSELEEVQTSIRNVEANIDRISRELDLVSSDIHELTERIERITGSGATWETLGMEVVATLSTSQCVPLIWELLAEKADAIEAQKAVQYEKDRMLETVDDSKEKIQNLEKLLRTSRAEMTQRLADAELQRIQDLYDVLNGKSASSTDDPTGGSDLARTIPMLRAQELERELETSVTVEAALREEIAELKAAAGKMERKLQATEVRNKLEALTAKTGAAGHAEDNSMDDVHSFLQQLWDRLGESQSDRLRAIVSVEDATAYAKAELLANTRAAIKAAEEQTSELYANFHTSCRALGEAESRYWSPMSLEDSTLLPLLEGLTSATQKVLVDLKSRSDTFSGIKDRLLNLVAEMGLDVTDLSPQLQEVMRVEAKSLSLDEDHQQLFYFALKLNDAGIVLTEEQLATYNGDLMKLNAVRAVTLSRAIHVRSDVFQLVDLLGISSTESLLEIGKSNGGTGEDSCMEDQRTSIQIAVELTLLHRSANPPGNERILIALEQLRLALKSTLVNRESSFQLAQEYLTLLDGCTGTNSFSAAITGPAYDSSALFAMLQTIADAGDAAQATLQDLKKRFLPLIEEASAWSLENRNLVSSLESMLAAPMDISTGTSQQDYELVESFPGSKRLSCIVTEMSEMAMFCEESWLTENLTAVGQCWEYAALKFRNVYLLRMENQRIQSQCDMVRELRRLDNQLERHVAEMEAFEQTSKQERQKVLSGSSKALIEEEKFRKNGKKKYEMLSEKIVSSLEQLHVMLRGERVDVTALCLSSHGRELLQGLAADRIELMHLHTINHGIRRWSGDLQLEDRDNGGSNENVSSPVNNIMLGVGAAGGSRSAFSKGKDKHSTPAGHGTTSMKTNYSNSNSSTSGTTAPALLKSKSGSKDTVLTPPPIAVGVLTSKGKSAAPVTPAAASAAATLKLLSDIKSGNRRILK